MKKTYIKPSVVVLRLASECSLLSNSNGNFNTEIGEGEMEFDSKENVWDDFSGFSSFNDNTWGDTWKEEE